jgi:fructokinase
MLGEDYVWVVGEALIDLVPDEFDKRIAIVGGGPANTAKSLANLGCKTQFIGGISDDQYGEMIKSELSSYGVMLDLTHTSTLPTATATVTLDKTGSAEYEFSLSDTATFDFHTSWLPNGNPIVIHIGTLAAIIEPGASALWTWAKEIQAPIVFDPNIRPSVMQDQCRYRECVEKWMRCSSVVKMSDEDFCWLYPNLSSGADLLEFGPQLIVMTHGARGLTAYHGSSSVSVTGFEVEVVDTVGAGDTVGAVIVESIFQVGIDRTIQNLEKVLSRAAKAAAITCSRSGAHPPSAVELQNT